MSSRADLHGTYAARSDSPTASVTTTPTKAFSTFAYAGDASCSIESTWTPRPWRGGQRRTPICGPRDGGYPEGGRDMRRETVRIARTVLAILGLLNVGTGGWAL